MDKQKVLFLCVSNTARSLMAEAILRQLAGDRFEPYSAGLRQGIAVAPETFAVLEEAGYDTTGLRSKPVDEYLGSLHPAYLITMCDVSESDCPKTWPMGTQRMIWPVDDPARIQGPELERLAAFRQARDEIEVRIKEWVAVD